MIKPLLTAFLAGIFITSPAQQFSLLKDINPGTGSSNVCYLTDVNNKLFFAATNGTHGMELWKSDGTETGTVMVKDIRPGASNSSIGYLTNINGTLFFVANNGSYGTELWKSDGTTAGTVMVKDIRAGVLGSNPSGLVNLDGTLYFAADNGVHGMELWKSDGTSAGTLLVKDINALTGGSYPQALASVNGHFILLQIMAHMAWSYGKVTEPLPALSWLKRYYRVPMAVTPMDLLVLEVLYSLRQGMVSTEQNYGKATAQAPALQ